MGDILETPLLLWHGDCELFYSYKRRCDAGYKLQSLWENQITNPTSPCQHLMMMLHLPCVCVSCCSLHLFVYETNLACWLPRTPAAVRDSMFRNPVKFKASSQLPPSLCGFTAFDAECFICRPAQLYRNRGAPKVWLHLHRSLRLLCCLMSLVPQGVCWQLRPIPNP